MFFSKSFVVFSLIFREREVAQCQQLLFPVSYATKHQEVTGSKQVVEAMTQLDSLLKNLEQIVMKTLGDVDAKKKLIKSDGLLKIERMLMVWFHSDEQRLKQVYKDLTKRLETSKIKE